MAIDDGRAWALKTLGSDGVLVREQVPAIIRACHDKMANAQAEADMKHAGPYGYIWRRCLVEFSTVLGQLPSAEIIPVPRAGYNLISFNGVVLFPWRFARERSVDLASKRFAISESRVSFFREKHVTSQPPLDFEFEHSELTAEEEDLLKFLDAERKALAGVLSDNPRVVVIPYSSNPVALHSIRWGEATLGEDGFLNFESLESLLDIGRSALAAVDPVGESFDDGPIPRPLLGAKDNEEDEGEALHGRA